MRRVVDILPHGASTTESLPYDHLVVALGTVPDFLRLPGVEDNSFTLKTLDDATRLRNHVIECLEQAEQSDDPEVRRRKLAFLVAGAGFAGTEMIAGIFDLVHEALHLFPSLDAAEMRFALIHSRERILPDIGPELADTALRKLRARGIEFILGARVTGATEHLVTLDNGLSIPTETLVWTAGNRPNPVVAGFAIRRNRRGQLPVDDTLQVCGYDNIWALGDCAEVPDPANEGAFCPPTAQHAMRQGKAAARNIVAYELGLPLAPFRFKTLGFLVSLGHRTAAAELRGVKLTGIPAWLLWRGIYLVKLPGAEKRMRVLFDWIIDLFFPRDIALTKTDRPGRRGPDGGAPERVPVGAGGRHRAG
jgi:NADH dehydrogenase